MYLCTQRLINHLPLSQSELIRNCDRNSHYQLSKNHSNRLSHRSPPFQFSILPPVPGPARQIHSLPADPVLPARFSRTGPTWALADPQVAALESSRQRSRPKSFFPPIPRL